MPFFLRLLARLRDVFDWTEFVGTVWDVLATKLGITAAGGLTAVISSLFLEATPLQSFAFGLAGTFVVSAGLILRELKRPRPPFLIIFDEANPQSRYWSEEAWPPEDDGRRVRGVEYRLGIRNETKKTIQDVSVTIEGIGGDFHPSSAFYLGDRSNRQKDIHPKSLEYVVIFMVPGRWKADFKFPDPYTITIHARGKDVIGATRIFRVDESKTPALTAAA